MKRLTTSKRASKPATGKHISLDLSTKFVFFPHPLYINYLTARMNNGNGFSLPSTTTTASKRASNERDDDIPQ